MAIAAAIIVGVTLFASGLLKLARPQVWWAAATGLGVPCPVAGAVPVIEVIVGALLTAQLWRGVLGWVAAGLLGVFTLLLIIRLLVARRRGERPPPCACFGAVSKPISWWSVGRNAVLIVVAVIAAVAG